MGPLAEAAGEASPGGEVGGMAVAQVPLTNLNNKQGQHWRYKQAFLQSFMVINMFLVLLRLLSYAI